MKILAYAWLALFTANAASAAVPNGLHFENFGSLEYFPATNMPDRLVIYFTGEKGWTNSARKLAASMADDHTSVVGVNGPRFERTLRKASKKCLYPSGDFELLSKFVQSHFKFREYRPPLLVVESEAGEAMAYASLAQAPRNTFSAAISLNFCPSHVEPMMYCKGYGVKSMPAGKKGFTLLPFEDDLSTWGVLQGDKNKSCPMKEVKDFVQKVGGAKLTVIADSAAPDLAHWEMPLREEMERLMPPLKKVVVSATQEGGALEHLPLTVVPAAKGTSSDDMVVFYSGDGGWAGFDQELAASLSDRGLPVVGLSTLKYFWTARDPADAAKDLDSIIRYYLKAWKKDRVRLVGYSFGADVMPELVSRLPAATKKLVRGVHLLGLSQNAEFEFHFESWLGDSGKGLPVKPALDKIASLSVQCFYGEEETDPSLCATLDTKKFTVEKLPGGHHFGGDSEGLAKLILGQKR